MIKDKKGVENVVADHLSRLVVNHDVEDPTPIKDMFPEEHLFALYTLPWYADLANYLATGAIPSNWTPQDMRKLEVEARSFFFDDPYMFKYCADQIIRRCIPNDEIQNVLSFCHDQACGGHFSSQKTAAKVLQSGLYWPTLFKDSYTTVRHVIDANCLVK